MTMILAFALGLDRVTARRVVGLAVAFAGMWRYADERVVWEAFGQLDRATRREVDDEAERLRELHAYRRGRNR